MRYLKSNATRLPGLIRYLTKGELGPLNTSLRQDEVQGLLGSPQRVGRPYAGTDQDRLLNLFYPNLTVTFLDEDMALLVLELAGAAGGISAILELDWSEEVRRMDLTQFANYLKAHAIGCKRIVRPWEESEAILVTSTDGVTVYFHSETGLVAKIVYSTLGPSNWQTEDCW